MCALPRACGRQGRQLDRLHMHPARLGRSLSGARAGAACCRRRRRRQPANTRPSPAAQAVPARKRPEYVPNRIDDPNYVRIFDTTLRDGEQRCACSSALLGTAILCGSPRRENGTAAAAAAAAAAPASVARQAAAAQLPDGLGQLCSREEEGHAGSWPRQLPAGGTAARGWRGCGYMSAASMQGWPNSGNNARSSLAKQQQPCEKQPGLEPLPAAARHRCSVRVCAPAPHVLLLAPRYLLTAACCACCACCAALAPPSPPRRNWRLPRS